MFDYYNGVAAVDELLKPFTSELFPDPETPVTQINIPSGNLTSMFFRTTGGER